jgi:cell division protein FtsI/penicillin-binding protein 2
MKPLTAAAALDMGVVKPNSSYFDPSFYEIDDYKVKNIEEDGGPGQKNITDILNLSLNTGATWLVMKMGGSNDTLNRQGREAWYNYMTNHFMFGRETGIEQGYEAEGSVPDPVKGYGRNLTYANASFGQAMTATPLQMAAAFAATVNGGTYYRPQLVDYTVGADGTKHDKKPEAVKRDVVSRDVSDALRPMLETVVNDHSFKRKFDQKTYSVGGKTGTAQIADPSGGYLADDYNGTYIGFVGGDEAQYIISIRVNKPKVKGYAGTAAAQPIFGDIAHMILDNFSVTPKQR